MAEASPTLTTSALRSQLLEAAKRAAEVAEAASTAGKTLRASQVPGRPAETVSVALSPQGRA